MAHLAAELPLIAGNHLFAHNLLQQQLIRLFAQNVGTQLTEAVLVAQGFQLFGAERAAATKSAVVRQGALPATINTFGLEPASAIGVKSVMASYGMRCMSAGLIPCELMEASSSV